MTLFEHITSCQQLADKLQLEGINSSEIEVFGIMDGTEDVVAVYAVDLVHIDAENVRSYSGRVIKEGAKFVNISMGR